MMNTERAENRRVLRLLEKIEKRNQFLRELKNGVRMDKQIWEALSTTVAEDVPFLIGQVKRFIGKDDNADS